MKDKLDQYIDSVRHLPPAPDVMVQLIALFKQPDHDIDQVVHLISHDPSLTAEMLKRCNSSFFGGDEPAANMFEAVLRLGFYEAYRIVLAMSSLQAMSLPEINSVLSVEALWQHSAATAAVAGLVAGRMHESEGVAFTAGLLHDVGKIIFASQEGEGYCRLMRSAEASGLSLDEAEKEAYGFDHGEVGARLLTRWGLTSDIVLPVGHHHHLAGAEPCARLAATVNLADGMAHCLDESPSAAPVISPRNAEAMAVLQLAPEDLPALWQQAQEAIQQARGLMPV